MTGGVRAIALPGGTAAVAPALHGTLANPFAGFHLIIEKSTRVGAFIKPEPEVEGVSSSGRVRRALKFRSQQGRFI
jgi:hypothetical protein